MQNGKKDEQNSKLRRNTNRSNHRGYRPMAKVFMEHYQPTKSIDTQPPNTCSNVQPAPKKKK